MKKHYNQTQINFDEQITLLKSEGMIFKDETKAKHLLMNISLFRIKSYLRPFRQTGSQLFKPNTTFEQVYELYRFDTKLRRIIVAELEKIEVSVRTQLSYCLTDALGNHWFTIHTNFKDETKHCTILASVQHELSRSDDDEIISFFKHYDGIFPPSWMTMEVTSFGTLSMLYKCLKGGYARRAVARFYGLTDSTFESWLHCMVYIRNICAHHGRLWNRTIRIQPVTPKSPRHQFLISKTDKSKLFYLLSIILYLLQTINPTNTFVAQFKTLLKEHPNVDTVAMGFPMNWKDEKLWK